MSESFLAYISANHKIKFEDVATDALTFIVQNSFEATTALRNLLNSSGIEFLPLDFLIETRRSVGSFGNPDLLFRSLDNTPRVIIESKFRAAFTKHQLQSYQNFLTEQAPEKPKMLVFLVPNSRVDFYLEKYKGGCGDLTLSTWFHNSTPTEISDNNLCVRVIAWEEVIQCFELSNISSDLQLFLKDLKTMCGLAEPDAFKPFTAEELMIAQHSENDVAIRFRNYLALASDIAKEVFGITQEQHSKFEDAWGDTWSGLYGQLGTTKVWIGLDASNWSARGQSPIWLIIEDRQKVTQLRSRMQLSLLKMNVDYFVASDGKKIEVPLRLSTGTREEVLDSCCNHVHLIQEMLESETLGVTTGSI